MAARAVAGVGVLLCVVLTGAAAAQEEREADGGAGDVAVPRSYCLSDIQRAAIKARLAQNVERLTNEGAFPEAAGPSSALPCGAPHPRTRVHPCDNHPDFWHWAGEA